MVCRRAVADASALEVQAVQILAVGPYFPIAVVNPVVPADKVVADSVVDICCVPIVPAVLVVFVQDSIVADLVAVDTVHDYIVLVDRQHYFANRRTLEVADRKVMVDKAVVPLQNLDVFVVVATDPDDNQIVAEAVDMVNLVDFVAVHHLLAASPMLY